MPENAVSRETSRTFGEIGERNRDAGLGGDRDEDG